MHARNKCASSDTRTGKHARASLTCQYPFRRCRTSTIFPGTHHSLRLDSMSAGEGEAGQQGAADRGGAATRAAEHCGSRAATYCRWPSQVKGRAGMLELKQQRQWTRTPKTPNQVPAHQSKTQCMQLDRRTAQRSAAQRSAARTADVPCEVAVHQALGHGEAGVQVRAWHRGRSASTTGQQAAVKFDAWRNAIWQGGLKAGTWLSCARV